MMTSKTSRYEHCILRKPPNFLVCLNSEGSKVDVTLELPYMHMDGVGKIILHRQQGQRNIAATTKET